MNFRVLVLLFACNISSVQADACDVITRSQSTEVPAVETHICYQYEGMPADAISWSCVNESKEKLTTTKIPIEHCPDDFVASCRATMTQKTLVNPDVTSGTPKRKVALLPDNTQPEPLPALEKGGAEEPLDHALGCSRGGLTTKIHVLCVSNRIPLCFNLSGGKASDIAHASP